MLSSYDNIDLQISFLPEYQGEYVGHMTIAPERNQKVTFQALKTVVRGIAEKPNIQVCVFLNLLTVDLHFGRR